MGSMVKQIRKWWTKSTHWLMRRVHNLTMRQRIVCGLVAAVLMLAAAIPTVRYIMQAHRYTLDDATLKLLGKSNANLASKLTYDTINSQWQFNKDAITDTSSTDPADNIPPELKAQLGGSGEGDESLYAIDFPTDPTKGVTVYDSQTQISFTMTPQFRLGGGKATKDNRIVYAMPGGGQLVYTPKNNGMKEDIVLPEFIGAELIYSYKLDLPDTLSARVLQDGSVGVYSIDPTLLGNVSTGSDGDAEKLASAREHAEKTHLLFAIPAPTIAQSGDSDTKATARFGLSGGILTITARNMDKAQYPVAIDPTVVVTSSTDFASNSRGDGMIDYSVNGQISRGTVSGGTIGSWGTTTSFSSALVARTNIGSVIYNGYVYILGGYSGVGRSDTAYAPINSDGTVGTWQTTTSLPVASSEISAVAHNGYMYVLGGTEGGGASFYSTVRYAPINSGGGLGSWSTTSSFSTGRSAAAAAVYGNYMYILGGQSSYGTGLSDVQYAAINVDGTLGTWQTTTSLTGTRAHMGIFTYNDNVYVLGGYYGPGGTIYTSVLRAAINSDGTLGSWATDTSLPGERVINMNSVVFYKGYVYLAGGWDGGYTTYATRTNVVYYAPVNADGSIGTWGTTTSFTNARIVGALHAYNDRLYIMGGDTPTSASSTTFYGDVQYVSINPTGSTTAYTANSNSLPVNLRGASVVVHNSYLFVISGGTTTSASTSAVYRALISSDGTVGSFSATTSLVGIRAYGAAVSYNGYIYVIGGCSQATFSNCTTSGSANQVYYGAVDSSGNVASWTSTTNIGTARYGISAAVYNGRIYVMGGVSTATFYNTIQYATIASNGSVGAWTTATRTLPASMAHMASVIHGGVLYVAGGCTVNPITCTTTSNAVYYATINNDGSLAGSGSMTQSGTFTDARGDFGMAATNGYLYITGGRNSTTYYNDTQFAPINSDGTVGTWSTANGSTLATARAGNRVVLANGTLYSIGGFNGSTYYNTVLRANVNNGGSGAITAWTVDSVGAINTPRALHQTVAYNGYLYVLGGRTAATTFLNTVEYAPINADGTVGTWATTTAFTDARRYFAAAAMNDYMYILGGQKTASTGRDIRYAPINTDGTLGTWLSAGSDVSNGGIGACMLAHNGYIYSIGGNDGGSTDYNTVVYAAQNTNGTVGAWQNANSFTTSRSNLNCAIYGDYMYLSGGEDSTSKNDVQYTLINSDGSIGSWNYTSYYNITRSDHAMIAYNGYMYVIGGAVLKESTARNDAQFAPINANGTLGNWQNVASPGAYPYADAAVYNGRLYIPGQNTGTYLGSTAIASLSTIPRLAKYSKLVDVGSVNKITGVTYGGTLSSGTKNINYRIAGDNGVFGTTYNVGRPPSPEGPCVGTYGLGRYVWLSVTMDDTATGLNSVLTDITTIYQSIHPAPDVRLHGGKTLENGDLSALDTCDE